MDLAVQTAALPFHSDLFAYAIAVIERHGCAKGLALATWRICRCHQFGGHGYDPVPPVTGAATTDDPVAAQSTTVVLPDPHHPGHPSVVNPLAKARR